MTDKNWIKARMADLGITQVDVADALGIPSSRVSELFSGVRKIQIDEIYPFSKIMLMSESDVVQLFASNKRQLTDTTLPHFNTKVVKIIGQVMAGCFMDTDVDYTDPEGFVPVSSSAIPGNKNYFGLRVRGDSMDKLLADGDIVICVNVAEYDKDIKTGALVIVDRAENGLVESTVKEYELREDGTEYLWPRSNNPDFQSPIRFDTVAKHFDDGGLPPVAIRAVVIYSMKKHG
jgi:SOS-response transcriptional repressor LexA